MPASPTSNCPDALDRLHARLDGDPSLLPDGVRVHLDTCATCRERFRAADIWLGTARPALAVPPQLADRVVIAVLSDAARRRRVWRLIGAGSATFAASVAIWLSAGPQQPSHHGPVEPVPAPVAELVVPPTFDVGDVGGAVASMSRRTAADLAGRGRSLLPEAAIPATLPTFEGAARPLDEARNGLAEGFEPVTASTRRAFGLLNAFAVEMKN